MSQAQTIAVLDFGSQYTQVIARRIRECSVYSRVYNFNVKASELRADHICGIILSGGPASVLGKDAIFPDKAIFNLGVPILGICYGLQVMGKLLGGRVDKSERREYGSGKLSFENGGALLAGLKSPQPVWNSHGDRLKALPEGFCAIAQTDNSEYAVIEDPVRKFYGLQFHPEVVHTPKGKPILENFLYRICGCKGDWKMSTYAEQLVREIREQVGDKRVILGLSGGVDSSVVAALVHKAIGKQLTCVFVDNGLMRMDERKHVEEIFRSYFKMNLKVVNASSRFLKALKGVTDPERKRKIIGRIFVRVFEDAVKNAGQADFLAQGTIYPDVIESSANPAKPSAVIKSHHNVGGLPKRMKFKLLEPIRELFKDEVRVLGEELGLPHDMLWRHPFPGPGLGVRVAGEITAPRLNILRKADVILQEEMVSSGWYAKVWQSFCIFVPVRTVGVMGDERTYDWVIAVRIVNSTDAMTADWSDIPHEVLARVSNRIINEVKGVNRVVLDISSKPPATIEWE